MLTRSKRLQKKLYLHEFKEMGLEVRFETKTESKDTQVLAELSEVMRPRSIAFLYEQTGSVFMSKTIEGSLSNEDRGAIDDWFKQRSDIVNYNVGLLADAWYPPRSVRSFKISSCKRQVLLELRPTI